MESIGSSWIKVIGTLQKSGIKQVGDLVLNDIANAGKAVEWLPLQNAPPSLLSGSRKSAFFLRSQKKVYYVTPLPKISLPALPQLELHEVMGALGYDDDDGALSMALILVSRLPQNEQRSRLVQFYGQVLFANPSLRGGTSVSGGGDLTTTFFRDQTLKYILSQKSGTTSEFLRVYPLIRFEPLQDRTLSTVVIQYRYLVRANTRGQRELFSVFLPMSRAQGSKSERQDLVQQVSRKITELFRAYPGQTQTRFQPSSCSSAEQTVIFPHTRDHAVAHIQDFRGGLALQCHHFSPGMTGYTLTSPAITADQDPRVSGSFHFTCQFKYNQGADEYNVVVPAGQSRLASHQVSIDDEDFLGDVWIAADGKILRTGIQSMSTQKDPRRKPVLTPSVNSNFGKSEIEVRGKVLTYQCRRNP